MFYEILFKTAFRTELLVIPPNEVRKIMDKVGLLETDPFPDSKNKKRLKGKRDLYRLRVGKYRVVYSFGKNTNGQGIVTLYGVDTRASVYEDGLPDPDDPIRTDVDSTFAQDPAPPQTTPGLLTEYPEQHIPPKEYLPIKFTPEILNHLKIPASYHAAVCRCETSDDLLALPMSDDLLDILITVACDPDWEQRAAQPDLVVADPDDLVRYAEGELVTFLLKLDPEQEAFVRRAIHGTGPMLVKGGPGTGKSTIALYRIREMIKALRQLGNPSPRILLTTYTNALANSSGQQLDRLLGADVTLVDVRTVDSLVARILYDANVTIPAVDDRQLPVLMNEAIMESTYDPDPERARRQRDTLARLGGEYLADEIKWVIEGRDITTREAYLAAPRAGRGVPLNDLQREAVWTVYQTLRQRLASLQQETWSGRRRLALEHILATGPRYDAVFIDEAQDLDPVVLRMLVHCCRNTDRLFITADANQSIYGSTFRWADVHLDLKFRGRTGTLNTNHRSTLQIDQAARAYLNAGVGALDDGVSDDPSLPETNIRFTNTDGAKPRVRIAAEGHATTDLLAEAIRSATRDLRIGHAGCAVLVPMQRSGKEIAALLTERGIPAEFIEGKQLDLRLPKVKVITLKSAKGLEFPFVALAGFQPNFYPNLNRPKPGTGEIGEGAFEEAIARERRAIFVGMTRAMRDLLVVVPTHAQPPLNVLYQGFPSAYWDTGQE